MIYSYSSICLQARDNITMTYPILSWDKHLKYLDFVIIMAT